MLKEANSFRSKYKIPKGANSYGEQTLSLKNRKTKILNSQSIRMLQTHVNNDIYNKYCLIYITIYTQQQKKRKKLLPLKTVSLIYFIVSEINILIKFR